MLGALAIRRKRIAERDEHLDDEGPTGTKQGEGLKVPVDKCKGLSEPWATTCKVGGSVFNFVTSLPAKYSQPAHLIFYYDKANRRLNGACIATTRVGTVNISGRYIAFPRMQQRYMRANGDSDWDPNRPGEVCLMFANGCVPMRGCTAGQMRHNRCRFGTRSINAFPAMSGSGDIYAGSKPPPNEWDKPTPDMPEANTVPPYEFADTGFRKSPCLNAKKRIFESWGKTARSWAALTGTSL